MKHKANKKDTWKNPTQSFIDNVDEIVQSGINQEDKNLIMNELDEMIELLENWKEKNVEDIKHKKTS